MVLSKSILSPLLAAITIGPAIQAVGQVHRISPQAIELLVVLAALTVQEKYTTRASMIDTLTDGDAQQFAHAYGRAFYELETAQMLTLSSDSTGRIRVKGPGHAAIRELSAAYATQSQQMISGFWKK